MRNWFAHSPIITFELIDSASGYVIGSCLKTKTSQEVAHVIERVFGILGPCGNLVTDFASCFTGAEVRILCRKWGVNLTKKVPGRSQGNGYAEIHVRHFRDFFEKSKALGHKVVF